MERFNVKNLKFLEEKMFKTVHFCVTVVRSAAVVKKLQKEHNFDVRYEDELLQQVIDFVMLRTLSNQQICQEILEMHTIDLTELAAL
jgi:hypothetical protein